MTPGPAHLVWLELRVIVAHPESSCARISCRYRCPVRKLLTTSLVVAAVGGSLSGCALLPGGGDFDTAWDKCIQSFERQPMNHWENSEIVETVPTDRSCDAYLEDLGRDEFALSFNIPEWVAVKEDSRRIMDVYHDSQPSKDSG